MIFLRTHKQRKDSRIKCTKAVLALSKQHQIHRIQKKKQNTKLIYNNFRKTIRKYVRLPIKKIKHFIVKATKRELL